MPPKKKRDSPRIIPEPPALEPGTFAMFRRGSVRHVVRMKHTRPLSGRVLVELWCGQERTPEELLRPVGASDVCKTCLRRRFGQ